ncbi:MAG: enoyl-CoA hydratase/isomerase family protein [Deltaproteobacteria bacterium]|nr:enoyl-CoA hydratase/isomerase family protein [Deltaproteobacteria bacterium]
MDYKEILVDVQDHIATVTLNRPQKLNAYTTLMGEELTHAYDSLGRRDDARVIIMTGAGRGFCSGADVGAVFQKNINERSQGGAPSSASVVPSRTGLHYALRNCPKPTIAAINGAAVGIGLTLTLLQDIRIMAEEASMGAIFARMGDARVGIDLHAASTHRPGQGPLFKTQDHKEAVAAFLEKRPARFEGK